jgi:sigma-B regulation protein RsbU (phosphoserine phosphatase)
VLLFSLLREDAAPEGREWLPFALVVGSMAMVASADRIATSVSLGYLYILPLGISAMFLRSEISYALIAGCIFLHDLYRPAYFSLPGRIVHNFAGLVGFTFVVYVIQRYVKQKERLAKAVREQRDDLLQDVELAGQVQRMFLPIGNPSIPGLDIAGMMQPARGVGGDYYNYIPINEHTIEMVIADVAGKGVPAALLMSAAAAAVQFEVNQVRDMGEIVGRLNSGIHSVSDGIRYVTLVLAELDAWRQTVRYVNCGHNPVLLFQGSTGEVIPMGSSCPPLGMFPDTACEIHQSDLNAGDVMLFYTDGLTEAENRTGEEFGMDRLRAAVQRSSSLSAERIMKDVVRAATEFCQDLSFRDDVTLLVVKCEFEKADLFLGPPASVSENSYIARN